MEQYLEELPLSPDFRGHRSIFRHVNDGFVYAGRSGGPEFWRRFGNNFEARESDIFIASFPRTGTTWTAEIVYLLTHDLDYEGAKKESSSKRCPYFYFTDSPDDAFDIPSPRCLRTHIPYAHLTKSILEKKCKIIYSIRNPKDALVSFYHHASNSKFMNYVGSFDTMFEFFVEKDCLSGSPFWKHVLQYWEHRKDDNFLITFFEEKKKDLPESIRKIAKFLGKNLTEVQVKTLAEHCSFDAMKSNPSVNMSQYAHLSETKSEFIRKGEVGGWKNYFSAEQNERMDKYIHEHFTRAGLEFTYEL